MAKDEKEVKKNELTQREKDFVFFYLYNKDTFYNATESYIKAFQFNGTRMSAGTLASKTMCKKRVMKYLQAELNKKTKVITKQWIEDGVKELVNESKYPRDKMKSYELLAKINKIIGNDDRQPDGITFNIGVPRPARPGAPDPGPVVEVDGEKFD